MVTSDFIVSNGWKEKFCEWDESGFGNSIKCELKLRAQTVRLVHHIPTNLLSLLLSSRVSFGSSKGSMVETLVFEAPTPLPEHSEREFSFPDGSTTTNGGANDDSGIELQEE